MWVTFLYQKSSIGVKDADSFMVLFNSDIAAATMPSLGVEI